MSTDEKLKQFVKRFVSECKKKGIDNPADLSEATIKAGYPISYTSAYKNWIGQNYPGLPSLIAYAETLGINIHYLVTGEQPPPAGDPKKLFKEFIEEHFQMTTEYVQNYLDRSRRSGASKNRYISTYNKFNRWCIKNGHARLRLDLERYPEPKEVVGKVIPPNDLQKLLEAAGEPFRHVIALGYHSGMRCGEIAQIVSDHSLVDFKTGVARLAGQNVKNRLPKTILLSEKAIDAILHLHQFGHIRSAAITLRFKRLNARLNLRYRFHDLRHTFVSRCRLIATASQTARLVGHKDPRTTELIYTHYDIETLRKIVESL